MGSTSSDSLLVAEDIGPVAGESSARPEDTWEQRQTRCERQLNDVRFQSTSRRNKRRNQKRVPRGARGRRAAISGSHHVGAARRTAIVEPSWLPGVRSRPVLCRGAPGRRQTGTGPEREETADPGDSSRRAAAAAADALRGGEPGVSGGDSASCTVKDPGTIARSAGNRFSKTQSRRLRGRKPHSILLGTDQ